jgi:predicted nucleotidyltransferase
MRSGEISDMRKEDRVRRLIAQEAARIMYEEGVAEYRDAKRKAARQFGAEKALCLGSHLPSNAEIHGELQRLIGIYEEEVLPERLMRLRIAALRQMEMLAPFHPYLVGSVLSGAVTERSDIDLHLFAESCEEVEEFLHLQGVPFEQEVVSIRHGGEFFEYPHIYLEDEGTVVECTVYPLEDIHRIPKSSITGRAMERANAKRVRKLIEEMVSTAE